MYNEYDKLFTDIYGLYMNNLNDENYLNRYRGKEQYFHASSAGLCTRKKYFETTVAPKTNPSDIEGLKRMRLGTVVHGEFEESINDFNQAKKESLTKKENNRDSNYINIYYNTLYNTVKDGYPNLIEIKSEREVVLDDLNVRGFYDFLIISMGSQQSEGMMKGYVDDEIQYHLFDLKTIGTYPYKLKFGRNPDKNPDVHHEMQLGTYGLAIERMFGRIDSMRLFYYRKNDSFHKFKEVPYHYIRKAETYWLEVNEKISRGLPPLEEGVSPVYKRWECSYCAYQNHCNELKDKGE